MRAVHRIFCGVACFVLAMPVAALAQTLLTVEPQSFAIAPNEEKNITAKEVGRRGAQPVLVGGSCEELRYIRIRTTYQDAAKRVLEARVRRTQLEPKANGRCNIVFGLRGQYGITDPTTVRVTLTR